MTRCLSLGRYVGEQDIYALKESVATLHALKKKRKTSFISPNNILLMAAWMSFSRLHPRYPLEGLVGFEVEAYRHQASLELFSQHLSYALSGFVHAEPLRLNLLG
jgi:hypothetical protein